MFQGFQQTNIVSQITVRPTNMFNGFPSRLTGGGAATSIVLNGLIAWWLSQQGIVLNGSTVASWTDAIGGYTLSQSTATNQPSYTAIDPLYNGYPSVTFTTTSQSLNGTGFPAIGTSAGQTVFGVIKFVPSGNVYGGYGSTNGSVAGSGIFLGPYFANTQTVVFFGDTSAHNTTGGLQPTTPVVYIITVDRVGGLLTLSENLTSSQSVSIAASLTNYSTPQPFTFGNMPTTVLEYCVYNRLLSTSEIAQNLAYLRAKYGI